MPKSLFDYVFDTQHLSEIEDLLDNDQLERALSLVESLRKKFMPTRQEAQAANALLQLAMNGRHLNKEQIDQVLVKAERGLGG